HQQAAARVVVLLVLAQMLGELADPRRQQRDLHLGGTGVVLASAVLLDDLLLLLDGERHQPRNGSRGVWAQISAASATSTRICSTSSSAESNRFSPRIRSTNAIRRVWP